MSVVMLSEREIRGIIGYRKAIDLVRRAFVLHTRGEVILPEVMNFDFRDVAGETHVKGAHLKGSPYFSIKVASGFYKNPEKGLPVGSGMVSVFDATTGQLRAVLFDNGFLTDLRTAASGAVATDVLGRRDVQSVGVLGCGIQARYQLEALLEVRSPRTAKVYCRTRPNAEAYAAWAGKALGLEVIVADGPEQVVRDVDVLITTTPAQSPVVRLPWLRPGTHVTAIGSDMPHKQELDADVLGQADRVAVDSLAQASRQGELHHALDAGLLALDDVHELGEIVAGLWPGRERQEEITVADLTGIGVLDAAVAGYVTQAAIARGMGRSLEV